MANELILSKAQELGISEDKLNSFLSLIAQAQSLDTKAAYSMPLDFSETIYSKEGFSTYTMILAFLENGCKRISDVSKRTYKKGLECLFDYLKARQITNPTEADIEDYITYLSKEHKVITPSGKEKKTGLNANTIATYLVSAKRFFAFCEKKGRYPNVASEVKGISFSVDADYHTAFTPSQFHEIVDAIDTSDIIGLRDKAIVLLEAKNGLRDVEISRMKWGDFDGRGSLLVHGKGREEGGKLHWKGIKPEVEKALRLYKNARGEVSDEDYVFVGHGNKNNGKQLPSKSVGRIVKEHIQEIGFNDRKHSAHSLRKTFATVLLENGADIKDVARAMGHSSTLTTQIYKQGVDEKNNPVFDMAEKLL